MRTHPRAWCKNVGGSYMPNSLSQANEANHPIVTILEQGIISSVGDFVRLNIVDWKRHKPCKSEQQAMDVVSSWFVNRFAYTIAKVDLFKYPERDDFPGWKHAGNHEEIGQMFWNHFKYCFDGELRFHDSPDFSGVIYHRNSTPQEYPFYGDIGKVSPMAIRDIIDGLYPYTLWISVVDEHTQVILERLIPKDKNMTFDIRRDKEGCRIEELVPINRTRKS